ncbi:hypothetical protein [Lysobacter sp. Root604]|uniref:hypothetical protein n=1 Tax=Lysobacter sp. Root604 TaxID=1736568 RepID=UPI0006F3580C|nr:hypothetical protein [Lysobacter sp. Root604]KRA17524.1 hypothetical protein ASD69_12635 [Lysobacter sp. Root604]
MRRFALAAALLMFSAATYAYEWPLGIPSDAKSQYFILEIGGKWPGRTVITKRTGADGTNYSKRFYDCLNGSMKYLGNGATLYDMARSKPDQDMAPVAPRSVADYVGREACKR